jgi:hypothetical protein
MCHFQLLWLINAIVLVVLMGLLGALLLGSPFGILINAQNRMSLERLQVVIWTCLVISALFAVAITARTMSIEIPNEILALMGISIGSVAGGAIVNGTKAMQEPKATVPDANNPAVSRGVLRLTPATSKARFAELFLGDELTNHGYVDISKVQMFFFTVAIAAGYALVLSRCTFEASGEPIQFPKLDGSIVTLLGISHAGFLTVKAAPKTPTA